MISSFNKLNQIFISHIRSLSTSFNLPIHEFNPDPSTPIENQLLDLGHQRRLERENKPYRSSFRVYSIFEVKTNDDKRWLIEGANSEPAYIGFTFLNSFFEPFFLDLVLKKVALFVQRGMLWDYYLIFHHI